MVLAILEWAIVIRAVLSWIPNSQKNFIVRFVFEVTEPLVKPFRRIRFGGAAAMIDFSPVFALLALMIIRSFILLPVFNLLAQIL